MTTQTTPFAYAATRPVGAAPAATNAGITRSGVGGAVVIESRRHTAGLALPDGPPENGKVQFFASHPLFQPLDGQSFRSIRALERAVRSLEAAYADQRRTRDSRGEVWRSWQAPLLEADDDETAAA